MPKLSQRINIDLPYIQDTVDSELRAIAGHNWVSHVNQKEYIGDWRVLALRTQQGSVNAHPILQGFQIEETDAWVDLPVLKSLPGIAALVSAIPVEYKSIRLMELTPNSHIKVHQDRGLCIENGEARLHIPLQTHNCLYFVSNGVQLPMAAGQLWYINADKPHEVKNESPISRINLVMDCEVNDWLLEQVH
ncbi:aspartyl/asparaginyl beta-hydroxylase domain-containing protein [Alteromonas sp. D210916BOD_24]|uniref:aspartyl/asparaginyl beta-hydroxylase domain-containing protein n=1 Tax=Alteromonas sp. D210916BOD_24 TaxID=3157618 RepID=UPI00399D1618